VLSEPELRAVWLAVGDDDFGKCIKLLILLGARRSEVSGMRWSEIDGGIWVLPAERAKNRRANAVPLSPQARAIIEAVPRGERDQLFGQTADTGFTAWAAAKADLDRALGDAVGAWRTHDIRRTVATRMADIGVAPHVIEAVLNHLSGHKAGVAGIYNRSGYELEVKRALLRWGEYVERLIEGNESKVVPLRA
jgi:integrase